MQKDLVVQELKKHGCRITKQRLMLLDIILEEECSSCKEIFLKASKQDNKVGTATVYRMINTLEEIGAINRKNMYRIACGEDCDEGKACTVVLEDGSVLELSGKRFNEVIKEGLKACGLCADQRILSVSARSCSCRE